MVQLHIIMTETQGMAIHGPSSHWDQNLYLKTLSLLLFFKKLNNHGVPSCGCLGF